MKFIHSFTLCENWTLQQEGVRGLHIRHNDSA